MERRNVLTLGRQDPEFIAAAFTDASRNRRMIESRRLDIVIDGRPLRYWWRDWEQPEWQEEIPVADLVTKLSPTSARGTLRQLNQLQGPGAGHTPSRAELFYCPACFDITDGILTVEISRTMEAVTWRALGCKDEQQDGGEGALTPNATDFTFDPVAYDSVFTQARAKFSRGRCSEWISRWWSGPMRPCEHSP